MTRPRASFTASHGTECGVCLAWMAPGVAIHYSARTRSWTHLDCPVPPVVAA